MSMSEFVDDEVEDDDGLEDKKSFDFVALVEAPLAVTCETAVGTHTNYHVDRHKSGLEDDPALLKPV